MKVARSILVAIAIACAVATAGPPSAPPSTMAPAVNTSIGVWLPAKLEKVHDADTGVFLVTLRITGRFDNCYAPELGTAVGDKGTVALKKYAEGKQCMVYFKGYESESEYKKGSSVVRPSLTFGRFIVEAWMRPDATKATSGQSLSEWVVDHGYASSTHDGKLGE